jgi:CheY-like chemotaxis protein
VNQIAREFSPSSSSESKAEAIDDSLLPVNRSVIRSYLYELFNRITEIFDTNQFMMMTINRCIDHAKVSNNVGLLASISSFDLWNAINFPVDCIRRVQCNIRIIIHVEDNLRHKRIMSDKIWFTENIFCLLSNAAKFSDESTAEMKITKVDANHPYRDTLVSQAMHRQLEGSNPNPYLLVELFDSGKGVPEEMIHTLFSPFKQAQRRADGTGLGLYSLACRMRALGGFYGVRNRHDRPGAIFWFAIPYKEDETALLEDAADHDENASISLPITVDNSQLIPARKRALSILLVDDTVPILKVLANIFGRHGHQVVIAENGLKAIRALGMLATSETHDLIMPSYDAILMDLQMPIMDGFEAMTCIRAFESKHNLPHNFIIAMSANSDETTINEAIHGGADRFMSKPFQMETFNSLYHDHHLSQSQIFSEVAAAAPVSPTCFGGLVEHQV